MPNLYDVGAVGAGFVPGSGILDMLGQAPAIGGGMGPSFVENLKRKQYMDALMQMVGAAGDAAMIVPPVGLGIKGVATAGKTARAAGKASRLSDSLDIQKGLNLSYRGRHTAPSPDFGAPLHDLTGGGQMYPADVYSANAVRYYGTGYPKADAEAFRLAHRVRGNPDADVTMYRAVPNNPEASNINTGDWVTLSKEYAKTHGESALGGNYKILSKKVKAKDLYTNADSIHEFGYYPQ